MPSTSLSLLSHHHFKEAAGDLDVGRGGVEGKKFEGERGSVSEKQLHLQDACLMSFNIYP